MTVSTDQIETSLGRSLTDTELAQATQWVGDAELVIRVRLGDLEELDADVLNYVVREAVVNKIERKKGDNASAVTVAVDDGSVTRRYEKLTASDFDLDWWNMLMPGTNASAFSTRPSFEADATVYANQWPWL